MNSCKFDQMAGKPAAVLRLSLKILQGRLGTPALLLVLLVPPLPVFVFAAGPDQLLSSEFAPALCSWLAGALLMLWMHWKGRLPAKPGLAGEAIAIAQLAGLLFPLLLTGPLDSLEWLALPLLFSQTFALLCTRSVVLCVCLGLSCAQLSVFATGDGLAGLLAWGIVALSQAAVLAKDHPKLAVVILWVLGIGSLAVVDFGLALPENYRQFHVVEYCLLATAGAGLFAAGRWWLPAYAAPFNFRWLARPFELFGIVYIVLSLLALGTTGFAINKGGENLLGDLADFPDSFWLTFASLWSAPSLLAFVACLACWLYCSICLVRKRDRAARTLLAAPLAAAVVSLPYLAGIIEFVNLLCLAFLGLLAVDTLRESKPVASTRFFAVMALCVLYALLAFFIGLAGATLIIIVGLLLAVPIWLCFRYLRRAGSDDKAAEPAARQENSAGDRPPGDSPDARENPPEASPAGNTADEDENSPDADAAGNGSGRDASWSGLGGWHGSSEREESGSEPVTPEKPRD